MFILNESEYTTASNSSRYTGDIEGAMYAVLDNTRNWNKICEAASLMELSYYAKTGGNVWVTEGALDSLVSTVKAWFKKAIEKIKQIFTQFFGFISSRVADDKTFIKKYGAEISKKARALSSNNSILIQGWEFKLDNTAEVFKKNSNFEATVSSVGIVSDNYDAEEAHSKIRAKIIDQNGALDADEFRKQVKIKYYGEEDKKSIEITSSGDLEKYKKMITSLDDNIKPAKEAKEALEKSIKEAIESWEQTVKSLESQGKKDDDHLKEYERNGETYKAQDKEYYTMGHFKRRIEQYKNMTDDFTIIYGTICNAFKDRNRQARAICVKCLGLKQEGAYYGSGSLLGNVTIL